MKRLSTFLVTFGLIGSGLVSAALFSGPTIDQLQAKIAALPEGHDHIRAELHSELGMLLYRQGRADEAAIHFEQALDGETTRPMRKHIYLYLGKSYETVGRLDKAISAYEQAEQYDRKNWRRHRDLAGLYERARLYKDALTSYRKAIRLNPKEASNYVSLGRTLRKYGLYKEAVAELNKAIDRGGDLKDVNRELSLVYEGQSQYQAAAVACLHSLKSAPALADWSRLAYLSALAGDNELIKKALSGLKATPGSADTTAFHEALTQLLQQKPEQILAGATSNDQLQNLLRSVEREGLQ